MNTFLIEHLRTRSQETITHLEAQLITLQIAAGGQDLEAFAALFQYAHDIYHLSLGEMEAARVGRLSELVRNLRARLRGEAVRPAPMTIRLAREMNKISVTREWMTLGAVAALGLEHRAA